MVCKKKANDYWEKDRISWPQSSLYNSKEFHYRQIGRMLSGTFTGLISKDMLEGFRNMQFL